MASTVLLFVFVLFSLTFKRTKAIYVIHSLPRNQMFK